MKFIITESRRPSAVMLSKYGEVYPGVNNLFHPYPGDKKDGYPEIETCINWLCQNGITSSVSTAITEWLQIKVAEKYQEDPDMSLEDMIEEILFMDLEDVCEDLKHRIHNVYNETCDLSGDQISDRAGRDPLDPTAYIADFINERFLRIREGGKLDSVGENAIYFRISSHGYDWHRSIVEYLWDTYGSPKKMPRRIWIGHDLESNPPETVLFDGTPEELLEEEDRKIYEDLKVMILTNKNPDREAEILNRFYCSRYLGKYKSFK